MTHYFLLFSLIMDFIFYFCDWIIRLLTLVVCNIKYLSSRDLEF